MKTNTPNMDDTSNILQWKCSSELHASNVNIAATHKTRSADHKQSNTIKKMVTEKHKSLAHSNQSLALQYILHFKFLIRTKDMLLPSFKWQDMHVRYDISFSSKT